MSEHKITEKEFMGKDYIMDAEDIAMDAALGPVEDWEQLTFDWEGFNGAR